MSDFRISEESGSYKGSGSCNEASSSQKPVAPTGVFTPHNLALDRLAQTIFDTEARCRDVPSLRDTIIITPGSTGSSRIETIRDGLAQFAHAASEKGMTPQEIETHLNYIADNFSSWVEGGRDVKISKEEAGLARSIEYISETGSVITNFKRKVGPGGAKGAPLGEGQFAVVKHSIVSASIGLPIGGAIADKVLKKRTLQDQQAILREGEINRAMNDTQHVRKCYRVNQRGLLLEGMNTTLDRYLAEPTGQSRRQIAGQLINGMDEMHKRGYVHRDIHPQNCFGSADGTWKLGDLGAAQKIGEVSTLPLNLMVASPSQIAGEVFNLKMATAPEDDVYAMGRVLYLLETGQPPPVPSNERILRLQALLAEKNLCLAEIQKLPSEEKTLLLKGLPKESLPPHLHDLHARYGQVRGDLSREYRTYLKEVNGLYRRLDDFGSQLDLVRRMMEPSGNSRISVGEALKEINALVEKEKRLREYSGAGSTGSSSSSTASALHTAGAGHAEPFVSAYNTATIADLQAPAMPEPPVSAYNTQTVVDMAMAAKPGVYATPIGAVVAEPDMVERLYMAINANNIQAIEGLIQSGFDAVHWCDTQGKSLLHYAAESKDRNNDMIEFLCKAGADINATDVQGQTPLFYAAKRGNIHQGKLLIALGANKNHTDDRGFDAAHYAETEGNVRYLDENKLLMGVSRSDVSPVYFSWHLNQALMLEFLTERPGVSPEAKEKLALLALNAYSKAASHGEEFSMLQEFQMTPLFPSSVRYHRSTYNELLKSTVRAYSDRLNIGRTSMQLVSSPAAMEAIARQHSTAGKAIRIEKEEDIDALLEALKGGGLGENDHPVLDITPFVNSRGGTADATRQFKAMWEKRQESYRLTGKAKEAELVNKFATLCTLEVNGVHILHIVPVNTSGNAAIRKTWEHDIRSSGFVISPDDARTALLTLTSLEKIFNENNIPMATLATPGSKLPVVCPSIRHLVQSNACTDFEKWAKEEGVPPYAGVLGQGTVSMLKGLRDMPVDSAFQEEGIGELLQYTYLRILNALGTAKLRSGDMVAFVNEIETIHQEVQNILAILSIRHGYGDEAFGRVSATRLAEGDFPLVPGELGVPKVTLHPSAMNALSCVMSGIEEQKGSKQLNVAVLKDSYYEGVGALSSAKPYTVSLLNGDEFRNAGTLPDSFTPAAPLDAFCCEFHHNISTGRKSYSPEQVLEQVLALYEKGMVSDKFTLVVDTTIDLEKSDSVRQLLHNDRIKELVRQGRLNIVLFRSGQKFDMLGQDNYYGGIATTINQEGAFGAFNARMASKDDHLKGLSYQGMTHLARCAAEDVERYRKAIMDNTQRLYRLIPAEMIYAEDNPNPLQFARIDDDHTVFLQLNAKDPGSKVIQATVTKLQEMMKNREVVMTARSSFGFPVSNLTLINSNNEKTGKKEALIRINPGLEGEEQLGKLAGVFHRLQQLIDRTRADNQGKPPEEVEAILHRAILDMPAGNA